MDGWNTIDFLLGQSAYFQQLLLLVSGNSTIPTRALQVDFCWNNLAHRSGDRLIPFICAMVKSRYIGDGHLTFNRESL